MEEFSIYFSDNLLLLCEHCKQTGTYLLRDIFISMEVVDRFIDLISQKKFIKNSTEIIFHVENSIA